MLDRPSQLDLEGLGVSRGIFAPAIRYHKGIFYLVTTLVGRGGNFFVTADDPSGSWSDPVWLPEIDGIDPSFFFDENGSCYIVNNGPPPNNKPLYDGHRAIWIQRFDLKKNKLVGDRKIIVNGGTNINTRPVWIEGPHIYQKDNSYFLCATEGETAENHSEVVFKSQSVWGPWEPFPGNPILTQRGLPGNRHDPITCTGHADLVETSTGEWWAVFLGCQPYEPTAENYYNTGRETFMAPVDWASGWPVIGEKHAALKRTYLVPDLDEYAPEGYQPLNGAFNLRDDFEKENLSLSWNFLRTPTENWFELKDGKLQLNCRSVSLTGLGNPSFIARRQQHAFCSATVNIQFRPNSENEFAGLVAFQNESHFYGLMLAQNGSQPVVRLMKVEDVLVEKAISIEDTNQQVELRITAHGKTYDFEYRTNDEEWIALATAVDGTFLSTRIAGGFVGTYLGMYAFGETGNKAAFNWFEYSGK